MFPYGVERIGSGISRGLRSLRRSDEKLDLEMYRSLVSDEKLDLEMYRSILRRVWYGRYTNVLNDDVLV